MHDDMQPDNTNMMPQGEADREGAMAKADLYKLATYSLKLFKKLQDEDQLEGWVQAKITKAADYVASVYHYLEYEMKISEYGSHLESAEVYTESQKAAIHNKLMEAKEKVKALKVAQAKKQQKSEKPKKVEEGIFGGEQKACEACGGSGQMMTPEREIPEELKAKVQKYNRQAKAMHAASKRIDKNKNGIPDSEEMSEDFGSDDKEMKVGDKKKTRTGELTKTSTGVIHKNTSYADDGDADEKSGKGVKSHAKSQSAAEKKEKAPAQKKSKTGTWGMENSEKFDNRKKDESVAEAKALKGNQKKLDADDDGDIEADDLADLRAKKDKKVDEAKGKKPDFLDMDKDGDKKEPMKKAVADKKAGPKKGVNPFAKKTESVQVEKELVTESADMIRMRQLMTRLNG